MRIAIYAHSFAPAIGGVETYVKSLAVGLSAETDTSGKRNNVIILTQTIDDKNEDKGPFQIVRCPTVSFLWRFLPTVDVLHIAGPCLLPAILGVLRRRPIVIEHHGYQASCPNGLLLQKPTFQNCAGYFLRREYGKCVACQKADYNVVQSVRSIVLTILRRCICRLAKKNISISHHVEGRLALPNSQMIYYGIAPEQSVSRQVSPAVITFGYIGRLVAEKGLRLLLEAAAETDRLGSAFKLVFIGDGPERDTLKTRVSELHLGAKVRFTGFLSGAALKAEAERVDVVIMPSIWEETAGLSAIEQMMRGRCLIAADIGGLGEVVGSSALKFSPGDAGGLTKCMQAVINNRDVLDELGATAGVRARQLFAVDRMVSEHSAVFHQVAASTPR